MINIIKFYVFLLLISTSISNAAEFILSSEADFDTLAWSSLVAGDTVYINPGTYHRKINISTRGTSQDHIKVVGVKDGNGNRPVIDGDGATTPSSSDFHWQTPNLQQIYGVIFVSPHITTLPLPGYIDIIGLEIKNGDVSKTFTAEDGTTVLNYSTFTAGIYIRSAQFVSVQDCVIRDNGLGVFLWTGSGSDLYDGLTEDITISGNYFYQNGVYQSYGEHQIYSESKRTIIEKNRFGPNRTGSYASQIKDRGAGTIIRYNYFESNSNSGWMIDLVEPENGWEALGGLDIYKQTFVYGNVFVQDKNWTLGIHWNGDNAADTRGRATISGSKLLFYSNTWVAIADSLDVWNGFYSLFSVRGGGGDCLVQTMPGIIDVRNNIFSAITRTGNGNMAPSFGDCANANHNFGNNFAITGYSSGTMATNSGLSNITSGSTGGFVSSTDFHITDGSSFIGASGALPSEATDNYLGLDLTPNMEYVAHLQSQARASVGDLGAYDYTGETPPPASPGKRYRYLSISNNQ